MAGQGSKSKKTKEDKGEVMGFSIPCTPKELKEITKAGRVPAINDFEQEYMNSGSHVTQKQFIALRIVVRESLKAHALENPTRLEMYGLHEKWEEARQIVADDPEFRAYINLVTQDKPVRNLEKDSALYPGSLKNLRYAQEQTCTLKGVHDRDRPMTLIRKSPRESTQRFRDRFRNTFRSQKKSSGDTVSESSVSSSVSDATPRTYDVNPASYDDAEHEITPNVALILLLQGILDLIPGLELEWVFDPTNFKAQFDKASYTAKTDATLRSRIDREPISFVEVKKRVRTKETDEILMQEGAEAVGWLLHNRDHIVLKKQHWVYVTFLDCHDDYFDYLDKRKGKVTDNAYLNMQTFGPWRTDKGAAMESFAVLMVAFHLLARDKYLQPAEATQQS
ncbi:hypothetical protein CFD26_107041 [Aspergillus turcosus]|uniref:Uncharacterized protein n=1 Tax=Aspergillus turcosus TaxID=1245748 RepID=A0A421D515_9EURO|nr:hypothetical protein CFD26_107041 [Aspergillus turcosus]